MARRYIGDAVIEIKYRDTGDYAGTVSAGGHTWRFADLNAPKAGLGAGVAYDSPEAYDVMAASAVSFGSYYTTHNRGDAPEWAPSAEVADAIDEAVSGVMDDKGRYEVQRTWGGKISVRNEGELPIFEITLVGKVEHLRSFVHDLMATREWDGDPIKWRDRVYVLKSEPGFKRETLKLMARTSTKTNLVYALKSTPGVGSVEYDVQKIDTMPNKGSIGYEHLDPTNRCQFTWKRGARRYYCTMHEGHRSSHYDSMTDESYPRK